MCDFTKISTGNIDMRFFLNYSKYLIFGGLTKNSLIIKNNYLQLIFFFFFLIYFNSIN